MQNENTKYTPRVNFDELEARLNNAIVRMRNLEELISKINQSYAELSNPESAPEVISGEVSKETFVEQRKEQIAETVVEAKKSVDEMAVDNMGSPISTVDLDAILDSIGIQQNVKQQPFTR